MHTYYVKTDNGEHLVGCEHCADADMADIIKEEDSCEDCGCEDGDVVEGNFGNETPDEGPEAQELISLKNDWSKFGEEIVLAIAPVLLPVLGICRTKLPRLIERSCEVAERGLAKSMKEEGLL